MSITRDDIKMATEEYLRRGNKVTRINIFKRRGSLEDNTSMVIIPRRNFFAIAGEVNSGVHLRGDIPVHLRRRG